MGKEAYSAEKLNKFLKKLEGIEEKINAISYAGNATEKFNELKDAVLEIIKFAKNHTTASGLSLGITDISALKTLGGKINTFINCTIQDIATQELVTQFAECLALSLPPLQINSTICSLILKLISSPDNTDLNDVIQDQVVTYLILCNQKITAFRIAQPAVNNADDAESYNYNTSEKIIKTMKRAEGIAIIQEQFEKKLTQLKDSIDELQQYDTASSSEINQNDLAALINQINAVEKDLSLFMQANLYLAESANTQLKLIPKIRENNTKLLQLEKLQIGLLEQNLPEFSDNIIKLLGLTADEIVYWKGMWETQQKDTSQNSNASSQSWWEWSKDCIKKTAETVIRNIPLGYYQIAYESIDNKIKDKITAIKTENSAYDKKITDLQCDKEQLTENRLQIVAQIALAKKTIQQIQAMNEQGTLKIKLNKIKKAIDKFIDSSKKSIKKLFSQLQNKSQQQDELIGEFEKQQGVEQTLQSSTIKVISTSVTNDTQCKGKNKFSLFGLPEKQSYFKHSIETSKNFQHTGTAETPTFTRRKSFVPT